MGDEGGAIKITEAEQKGASYVPSTASNYGYYCAFWVSVRTGWAPQLRERGRLPTATRDARAGSTSPDSRLCLPVSLKLFPLSLGSHSAAGREQGGG